MKIKDGLLGALMGFMIVFPLYAAAMEEEIEHLLNFVEKSGCSFERNGTAYNSREARAHIQRKYDYIKGRVKSTEDFIRYAASESSMSGRKCHAICDGETITSWEWLSNELKRYRNADWII